MDTTAHLGIEVGARNNAGPVLKEVPRDVQQAMREAQAHVRQFAEATRRDFQAISKALEASGVQHGLQEVGKAAQEAERQVERSRDELGRFSASGGGGAGALQAVQGAFRGLSAVVSGLALPLRLAGSAFELLGGVIGGVGSIISTVVMEAFRAAQAIGGALVEAVERAAGALSGAGKAALLGMGAALAYVAKNGVQVNIELGQVAASLGVLMHSTTQATQFLSALRQEAASSSFEFTELADYSKRLLAVGFNAQQIIPTLRTLGDVAAGLAGKEGSGFLLDRLITALGQIRSKGVLQGEEAMQLQEAGIPVREILRVPQGQDFGDLKMSAAQAIPALLAGLQARFGGLQQQMVNTIPGAASNLKDAFDDMSSSVTKGLTYGILRGLLDVQKALEHLRTSAGGQAVTRALTRAFDALGDGIRWAARQLPALIDGLGRVLQSPALRVFVQMAQGAFTSVFRSALAVIGWISAQWPRMWRGMQEAAATGEAAIRVVLRLLLPATGDVFGTILKAWEYLWQGAQALLRFVVDVFAGIIGGFERSVGTSLRGIGGNWDTTWKAIADITRTTVKVIGGTIAGLIRVFQDLNAVQSDGRTGMQAFAESMRDFAIAGIQGIALLTAQVLGLAAAWGLVVAAIGLATKNWAMVGAGAGMFLGRALLAGLTRAAANDAIRGLQGLDLSKIGGSLQGLAKRQDPLGSFARGFGDFGAGFDDKFNQAAAGQKPGTPIQSDFPSASTPPYPPSPNLYNPGGYGPAMPAVPTPNYGIPSTNGYVTLPDGRVVPLSALTVDDPDNQDPFSNVQLPDGRRVPKWMADQDGMGTGGYHPMGNRGYVPLPSRGGNAAAGSAGVNVNVFPVGDGDTISKIRAELDRQGLLTPYQREATIAAVIDALKKRAR